MCFERIFVTDCYNVPSAAGQPRDSAEGGGSAQQESQDVCKVQVQEQTPVIAPKTFPIAIVSRQIPVIMIKTSQELRMLSSVTFNCQVTKIVKNSSSQLSEM